MKLKPEQILAVGMDPSKACPELVSGENHSVVAVRFPDEVLFKAVIPNIPDEIARLDDKMVALSRKEGLSLIYAPEDVTQYGGLLAKILQERGQ